MARLFTAIVLHDVSLAWRRRGSILSCLLFFVIASSLFPLAIGPDTYTMSKRYAPVGASADATEAETVANANQYCAQSGRQFVQVDKDPMAGAGNPYGPTYVTVTFRCVAPSDPAAATYQQQTPPSQPSGQ